MFKSLNLGMLRQKGSLKDTVALAAKHGFRGVDTSIKALKEFQADAENPSLADLLATNGLVPGVVSGLLPGKTTVPEEEWDAAIADLAENAELARKAGFQRTYIVMLPFGDDPFDACFALHVKRLGQAAEILAESGLRLGIEYVSQKTRRAGEPNEFIYTLDGVLKLVDAVGAPNLGILFDSFHWFCAGETLEDVRKLSNQLVVFCHVADAPERPLDEQVAFEREMPGEGIADLKGFFRELRALGYDGPITCEPFNAFEGMDVDAAVAATSAAMDAVIG